MQADDIINGIPAHWDNQAIQIIERLVERNGKNYTYADIAKEIGTSGTEVGRYLREAAFERRSWKWFEDKRKYSPVAYQYYLNNFEMRVVDIDGTPTKLPYVNFSKHAIFLMNCRLRNVEVRYEQVGKRRLVYLFENQTDMRTVHHYEVPQIEHEDLYRDLLTDFDDDTISGDLNE